MVYTITLNPSLDYIINIDNINIGKTNRSSSEMILVGGKGINISIVLKNLNVNNIALGFIAGFTGDKIEYDLKKQKINTDFIKLKNGNSRINVKIKSKKETEINCNSPNIEKNDIELLYEKLNKLNKNDIVVIAGSIPNSLPSNTYKKIIEKIKHKNTKIIVDTTKNFLLNTLEYKPFLIKPNIQELEEIFNCKIKNNSEIIQYAKRLKNMGAINVLISRGNKGAILIDENEKIYIKKAPNGKLINSVGSGDSMIAGFISNFLKTNNYEEAFKMSIACGSASAFSKYLATEYEIKKILNKIE